MNIFLIVSSLFITTTIAYSQKFILPQIPVHDSIYYDKYEGKTVKISFFLKLEKVCEIAYKTNSMLYTPLGHISFAPEDSCYSYFNNNKYDIYFIGKSHIVNKRYSDTSHIFSYHKFDYNGKTLEKGDYYFGTNTYGSDILRGYKYQIGEWKLERNQNNKYNTIDFDKLLVEGKSLESTLTGKKTLVLRLKNIADSKLIGVYGKKFVKRHIKFNMSMSTYLSQDDPNPSQPSGTSILLEDKDDISFVDLIYDLIIDNNRFDCIKIRLNKKGEMLTKTHFENYRGDFELTNAFDKNTTRIFHSSVLNWKQTAKQEGYNINSKGFNVRFDWLNYDNIYAQLFMILEEFTFNKDINDVSVKRLYINAWTGKKKEEKDTIEIGIPVSPN